MSKNPLIQDLIENEAFPSVTVSLPTMGRWYGESMFAEGYDPKELPVGVLGILSEQNYRDPWLLLSGEAIPRMLKSVCPGILEAGELAELDLDTILLASRLVSFGPTLDLKHTCYAPVDKTDEELALEIEGKSENYQPAPKRPCGQENDISIDINEHILRYAPITDEVVDERFTYEVAAAGQTVHLRPMPYRTVIDQVRRNIERDRKVSSFDESTLEDMIMNDEALAMYKQVVDMSSEAGIDSIVSCIFGVSTTGGSIITDTAMVREWLLALPQTEAEKLSLKLNELSSWMVSFSEIKYTCGACGTEQTFRLELDANRLFGPAGASTPPKKPSRKSRSGARRRRVQ